MQTASKWPSQGYEADLLNVKALTLNLVCSQCAFLALQPTGGSPAAVSSRGCPPWKRREPYADWESGHPQREVASHCVCGGPHPVVKTQHRAHAHKVSRRPCHSC